MKVWAIDVDCRACGAPAGRRCRGHLSYAYRFHTARHEAADAAGKAAMIDPKDIKSITIRTRDPQAVLQGLVVVTTVALVTQAGAVFNSLLCRDRQGERYLVYWDRPADAMVAQHVTGEVLGGWLRSVGQ